MATGDTTPHKQGSSTDQLECSICRNRYKEPRVLDCTHSFCLKCLQAVKQHREPETTTLTCPLCRQETMLLKEVADLPDNHALHARVEEVTLQEQLMEGQDSKIKCQACDEENQAISRCMDCKKFLCHECQKAHERWAALKSHKIYTLGQLRAGEIGRDRQVNMDVPKCSQHPDQDLNIFCNTCEQLVCATCSEQDHKTQRHSLSSFNEALHRCKQEIAEMAAQVEMNKSKLTIAMIETDKSQKKLDTMFADTNRKISQRAGNELVRIKQQIARIEEGEQHIKQESAKIYKDRIQIFESAQATNNRYLTQTQHKLDEVNRLVAQASCYEILDLKQKLLCSLRELTRKQPQQVSNRLAFIDFKEGPTSLGRLVLEGGPLLELQARELSSLSSRSNEKWELKNEVQTFTKGETMMTFKMALDIAIFSDNNIITSDIQHKLLIETSSIGTAFHSFSSAANIDYYMSHVSVNKDDQMIFLAKERNGTPNTVKIFDRQSQHLHDFMPYTPFSLPAFQGYTIPTSRGSPTCLVVTENSLIALGYKLLDKISLYTPDGTLINTMSAPMIGDHLTISKQQFIYTNWENKKLISVDYNNGRIVFLENIPCKESWWGPTAVCCDTDGGIYVGVCGKWPSPGDIQHFSPDGHYLGCIIEGSGTVFGMKFWKADDGDNLVVAAGNCVKIFKRC